MHPQKTEPGTYSVIEELSTRIASYRLQSDPEVFRSTSPRICVWRLVNGFMTCFFLFAAVVQINDPDPYIWIPIYLIPALLSGSIVLRPTLSGSILWRILCIAHLTVVSVGVIYFTVVVVHILKHELSNPLMTEEGRELAGLLIIGCWLTIGICAEHLRTSSNPRRCLATLFLVMSCIVGITPLFCWSMCFMSSFSALSHCVEMKIAVDNSSAIDTNLR